MNKRVPVLALFLTVFLALPVQAGLKERLVPITKGTTNMAVDRFIIATHDKYIATVVRDFTAQDAAEVGDAMREMATMRGNKDLFLVEKMIFDKNARKLTLVDRYMATADDPETRIATEVSTEIGSIEAAPGTLGGIMWDKVAGPEGLGRKILTEEPAPVALDKEHKYPVDQQRYLALGLNEIGGVFLDTRSIRKTEDGCSAQVVEVFDFDGEVHYGGLAIQHTFQPYVDASYAVTTYDFSFAEKAYRMVGFTKFSPEGKIIYSMRDPYLRWYTAELDPRLPRLILAVRASIPEKVAKDKDLAKDLASFDAFIAEAAKEGAAKQKAEAAENNDQAASGAETGKKSK